MPKSTEKRKKSFSTDGLHAISDEELASVAGGYQVFFPENGVNRDSWFVSLMTRRMIQDSIRRELASSSHTVPEEIQVGERRFRVKQVGDSYYVEEINV